MDTQQSDEFRVVGDVCAQRPRNLTLLADSVSHNVTIATQKGLPEPKLDHGHVTNVASAVAPPCTGSLPLYSGPLLSHRLPLYI